MLLNKVYFNMFCCKKKAVRVERYLTNINNLMNSAFLRCLSKIKLVDFVKIQWISMKLVNFCALRLKLLKMQNLIYFYTSREANMKSNMNFLLNGAIQKKQKYIWKLSTCIFCGKRHGNDILYTFVYIVKMLRCIISVNHDINSREYKKILLTENIKLLVTRH